MAKRDITNKRMSQIEMAEFENICLGYWKDGYDDRAIAHKTGKRLDMVQNTLWKAFCHADETFKGCIKQERTKFIVARDCPIKSIGNWGTGDFYEAHKDNEGNIVLTPLNK